MSKSTAIAVLLVVIAIGLLFGVARDLYSSVRATLTGTVVSIDAGGQAYKSSVLRALAVKVRLYDGRTVDVSATTAAEFHIGQTVEVVEMVMPWGQLWYKFRTP